MAVYDIVAIRKNDLEECRKIIFLAAIIAGSIGLHRDPGHWKLEARIVEWRRRLFWEMYMLSTWQDPDAMRTRLGQIIPGYKMWKLQFVKECLAPATDRLYSRIEILRRDADHEKENENDIANSLKNKILCYQGILRLYLHRNFFGKAISEFPGNPRQPPYGMTFLSVFNVAVSMLDMLHQTRDRVSSWIIHFWIIIAHAFECGFVVGSVAMRCSRTSFAEQGFEFLETPIALFKDLDHPVAKNGLPVLLRLREKARQAKLFAQIVPSSNPTASPIPVEDEDIDELSILRGSSRLVAQSSSKKSGSHSANAETSSTAALGRTDAFSM